MSPLRVLPLVALLVASSCGTSSLPPEEGEHRAALSQLKQAEEQSLPAAQRAALYLSSAAEAKNLLGSPASRGAAGQIYNKAAADLTVLLRNADQGTMWNRPQTIGGYRLRFAKASRDGVWDPAYFTSFTPADEVDLKTIKRRNLRNGLGGALVGVRKTNPLETFSPLVGITAPVTAVLDFNGNEATLTLVDPTKKSQSRISGKPHDITADFSAPLAYYPQKSEYWEGIMGAIRVSNYMKTSGLYLLEPYDPEKIPLIFVHGLISTPRMWRNVINEIETDPTLRGKYQCWVFSYPTGNPPAYSAMRFREELAKVRELYPDSPDYVLVGHSMGGIVSRMQATTVTRESWNILGENQAKHMFANIRKGSLIDRCTVFEANPKVDRIVFICTPHRGSEMAVGSIGELGMRLISLPADLTSTVTGSIGNSLAVVSGDPKRLPNSVTGLSPRNPMLKVLDSHPIQADYHTIAGDRGKGDTPNSSDGVVQYWSSRLSKAKSERIVPGPHGSCELPETLDELRRILHLHLKNR